MSKLPEVDALAGGSTSTTTEPGETSVVLTPDQIQRWARLVAEGRGELPTGLNANSHELLVAEVRLLLRARLTRFFAHAIAADIQRRESPGDCRPVYGGRTNRLDKEVQ